MKKKNAAFLLVALISPFSIPAYAGIDLNGGVSSFGDQGQNGPYLVSGASGFFSPLISSPDFVTINNVLGGVGSGGTPWMVQVADNAPDAAEFSLPIQVGAGKTIVDQFYLDISTIMLDNPQNPAYVDMGENGYAGTGILHDSAGMFNDILTGFNYFTVESEGCGFSFHTATVVPEPANILYGFAGVLVAFGAMVPRFRRAKD